MVCPLISMMMLASLAAPSLGAEEVKHEVRSRRNYILCPKWPCHNGGTCKAFYDRGIIVRCLCPKVSMESMMCLWSAWCLEKISASKAPRGADWVAWKLKWVVFLVRGDSLSIGLASAPRFWKKVALKKAKIHSCVPISSFYQSKLISCRSVF